MALPYSYRSAHCQFLHYVLACVRKKQDLTAVKLIFIASGLRHIIRIRPQQDTNSHWSSGQFSALSRWSGYVVGLIGAKMAPRDLESTL